VAQKDGRRPRWLEKARRHGDYSSNKRTALSTSSSSQATCDAANNLFDTLEYPDTSFSSQQQPQDHFKEWFSQYYQQLPDSVDVFLQRFKAILMHEPPVGIVAVFVTLRLIWTGRIFHVYHQKYKSVDGVLTQEEKKTRPQSHLKIPLDADDQSYIKFGGVGRIR